MRAVQPSKVDSKLVLLVPAPKILPTVASDVQPLNAVL